MRVLLDIKESKALFFMELLKNFSFVKARPITDERVFSFPRTEKDAVEIETSLQKKDEKKDIFAEVFGIWADREIDGKTLRRQAWGIEN